MTVQGEIDAALSRVLRSQEMESTGAGRTDAGVHALGQVMSVREVGDETDLDRLRAALNSVLGGRIAVRACTEADPEFNARFSARSRLYVYAILQSDVPDPFLMRTALWHRKELSLDAMNEAAGHLIGEHDFSSFGRVPPGASAKRTLFELSCSRSSSIIRIRARANAFIQQMVRSLVGTLIQVGEGRRGPDEAAGVLEARDRVAAGPVAPPHGLCLVSVEYDEGWSRPI
jgi:tRNA pseudouridine38-40 synthase